ncbi:L,D-transpeptidase [Sphingomonas sp. RS6]
MSAARPAGMWIAAAAVLVGSVAIPLSISLRAKSDPAPAVIVQPKPPAARITFPVHQLPRLALPDGSTRAVKSLLNVPDKMRYGDFVWNENGVGKGVVWIRVDLTRQLLSVFRDGQEIGTSVILYGADGLETPVGDFPIKWMREKHRSRTYDAPMPYTLRLTDDGVAIHGSNVREGAATHGCVGVPLEFARHLFAVAAPGDLVTIVR